MNLHRLLAERTQAGKPVRTLLVGAGKFGSMFLAQIPTTPGIEVAAIADLDPARARAACAACAACAAPSGVLDAYPFATRRMSAAVSGA